MQPVQGEQHSRLPVARQAEDSLPACLPVCTGHEHNLEYLHYKRSSSYQPNYHVVISGAWLSLPVCRKGVPLGCGAAVCDEKQLSS